MNTESKPITEQYETCRQRDIRLYKHLNGDDALIPAGDWLAGVTQHRSHSQYEGCIDRDVLSTETPERYCVDCQHYQDKQCMHPENITGEVDMVSGKPFVRNSAHDMRIACLENSYRGLNSKSVTIQSFVDGPCGKEGRLFEARG